MDIDLLQEILDAVAAGKTPVVEAVNKLKHLAFENLDYAHIDHHRSLRKGFPEVIFGEGKSEEQICGIMQRMTPVLQEMRASGRDYIICGDWNIAHKKIDLKNWRGNQKNSGFLPEERAWMDELFGDVGMADAFRRVDPREERYTWWSNRGRAWDNNTGWRIDYHVATPGLAGRARSANIYRDERFSDHAPLTMDYDYELTPGTAGS